MESRLKNNIFFNDYKKHTKDITLEEPIDYVIFRPLAYIVLKTTYWLPLRPNHFSLLALISAIFAYYYLSLGTSYGFLIGGVGILSFCVLDCCDGMLARMKNNGSKYGDLVDMFVDFLSNILFFTGIFIGLKKNDHFFEYEYLTWIGGISILVHSSIYQFYKEQYSNYLKNNPDARKKRIEQFKRDYSSLKRENKNIFDRLLIKLFIIFSGAQKSSKDSKKYNSEKYVACNKNILPLWGAIAGSSHLFILAVSLIMERIDIYFLFSIILSNVCMFIIGFVQEKINSSVETVSERGVNLN